MIVKFGNQKHKPQRLGCTHCRLYYNTRQAKCMLCLPSGCIIKNIARSEQSSHTPGDSHQRLKHFQRKDKIVKDFIILNQVVSEKTLMKNVHMCHIRMTEGKIENLNKEGKMRISTLIFIYTIHFAYLKVYTKFHNPKSSSS